MPCAKSVLLKLYSGARRSLDLSLTFDCLAEPSDMTRIQTTAIATHILMRTIVRGDLTLLQKNTVIMIVKRTATKEIAQPMVDINSRARRSFSPI